MEALSKGTTIGGPKELPYADDLVLNKNHQLMVSKGY